MRIKRIWISEYKNLKDFEINFDTKSPLSIIIGNNGSGKSNFYEALSMIMRTLYYFIVADEQVDRMNQLIGEQKLEISKLEITEKVTKEYKKNEESKLDKDFEREKNKINKEFQTYIKNMFSYELESEDVDGNIYFFDFKGLDSPMATKVKKLTEEWEKRVNENPFLKPVALKKIFKNTYLYYSGMNNRLTEIFIGFEDKFYRDLRERNEISQIPKMINFDLELSKWFIIIAFIYDNHNLKNIFSDKFQILNISSLKINFITPPWFKNMAKPKKVQKYWGYENNQILGFLEKCSNTLIINEKTKQISELIISKEKNFQSFGQELIDAFISEKNFLESIYTLYLMKLIKSVEVVFSKKEEKISYFNLSEGEKQLITIIGLININKEHNSLFLLDEPDTFLHPKWQRELTSIIEEIKFEGQILLTTHSPLSLGEVDKERVRVFKEGECFVPSAETLNRNVADVLEEAMEVSPRTEEIQSKISRFYDLIVSGNIVEARNKLEVLKALLSEEDPFIIEAKLLIEEN